MKALSIRQPWAWLIVHGFKPVENRTWQTAHRGEVYIHAGKKIDQEGLQWVREQFPAIPLPDEFESGGLVGKASVVDCVDHYRSPWFFGPFGFVLVDPEPIPFISCRGQLGLFNIEV